MNPGSETAACAVRAVLESGSEAAWTAFVRQFQPLIASSVARVVYRFGLNGSALIDDLIQETYLRICRDDCRNLRRFSAQDEEAIFRYIRVIATSVALDHFRARAAQKRRGEVQEEEHAADAGASASSMERAALLRELDQRLSETESERDRTIFWLYYRQGFTARDIAAIPEVGLTQKGVESCIYRLTQVLRSAVGNAGQIFTPPAEGKSPPSALGVQK